MCAVGMAPYPSTSPARGFAVTASTDSLWTATPAFARAASDCGDPVRRHSPRQGREVEPGRRRNQFEEVGEIAREGVRKHFVPYPVDCGHSTDVAREGAVIDEIARGPPA